MSDDWSDRGEGRPPWDAELASDLIGSRCLTFQSASGGETGRLQMHGIVLSADPTAGILVDLQGVRQGERYTLPPELSAFSPAAPGVYRLHETGEEIEDPDFTATWVIQSPD